MRTRPRLTIALEGYDRHMPFFMGLLAPTEGFELEPLEVAVSPPGRDGGNLHHRMLHDRAFDIAELSFASYVRARRAGVALTAVPVFPRRLFSQNHIFVRAGAGIGAPRDLIGRRVAIRAFQVTLSVLAKGDLASEYGVPWREIHWVTQAAEEISWTPPAGVRIERMAPGRTGAELLRRGEVDAFIDPRPPATVLRGAGGVHHLFADPRAETVRYFRKRRAYPIMHVLALKPEAADAFPELPRALVSLWEAAKAKTREYYEDFCFSLMPSGRWAYEEDERRYGPDPWPSGLAANRDNLEWFIAYLVDQTLLDAPIAIEELFHPSVLDG